MRRVVSKKVNFSLALFTTMLSLFSLAPVWANGSATVLNAHMCCTNFDATNNIITLKPACYVAVEEAFRENKYVVLTGLYPEHPDGIGAQKQGPGECPDHLNGYLIGTEELVRIEKHEVNSPANPCL